VVSDITGLISAANRGDESARRYFAGLTGPEIEEALGITERTVRRDWQKARLILAATLTR
jgi:predicted transcriptional regulator